MTSNRRLIQFFNNPARGLEYNEINLNRRVSRCKYTADIAHNPQLVRDIGRGPLSGRFRGFLRINVHARADLVNALNGDVNNYRSKVEGRT